MDPELELAQAAVRLNFITEQQLQAVLKELQDHRSGAGLIETLRAKGLLTDSQVEGLRYQVHRHGRCPTCGWTGSIPASQTPATCPQCGGAIAREVPASDVANAPTIRAEANATPSSQPPGSRIQSVLEPGTIIGNKFRVDSILGTGGMAVVYRGMDLELKRPVAIKQMRVTDQTSDELRRFLREARTASQFDHKNIVKIYHTLEDLGGHFIIMELVDGTTLDRWAEHLRLMKAQEPPKRGGLFGLFESKEPAWTATAFEGVRKDPPTRQLVEIARDILLALQHAHERGVVHRDLKPQNILVDRQGVPKLTDFGLAKDIDSQSLATLSGTILGTPQYMPPEQALGRASEIEPVSDVYAMGAILYTLLTGRHPFTGGSIYEILDNIVKTDLVPPRKLNPRIDPNLELVICKAMEKEKPLRYASAREMAEDLERFLEGRRVHARPPSLLRVTRKKISKSRRIQIALSVTLAAGLVGTGAFVLTQQLRQRVRQAQSRQELEQKAKPHVEIARTRTGAEALAEINKALEIYPEFADALLERAKLYYTEGRAEAALRDIERAIQSEPKNSILYFWKARILKLAGAPDAEVINSLETARKLNEKETHSRLAIAIWHLHHNDHEAAMAEVSDILRAHPHMVEADLVMGEILLKQNQPGQAKLKFDEAIKKNPNHAIAYMDRASALFLMQKTAEARQDLDRALAINPELADAYYNRGSMFLQEGDRRACYQDWKKYLEIASRAPLLQKTDHYPAAKKFVEDHEKTEGDGAPAASGSNVDQAVFLISRGELQQADQALRAAAQRNAEDPRTNWMLWRLQLYFAFAEKDFEKRKKLLREAAEFRWKWKDQGFDPETIQDPFPATPEWLRVPKK